MFDFRDERYNRQEQMPEWGPGRQLLLRDAHVAVIGSGGVKSSLLMALAAGGIGHIEVIEFDRVELSNLNRQTLFRTDDIGKPKGERAVSLLRTMNPEIDVTHIDRRVDSDNIDLLLGGADLVVEGGDSPAGRNIVNEYCLRTGKPMVHASAQFSYGYVFSVVPEQKTACFACYFPTDHTRVEHTGAVPVNVLSVQLAGTLGAAEVFRWFLGYRDRMTVNRRRCFSSLLLSSEFSVEPQVRRKDCPTCSRYY